MSSSATPASSRPPSPTAGGTRRHPLLQRPLYAFQVPPTILNSIQLRSIDVDAPSLPEARAAPASAPSASAPTATPTVKANFTCTLCPSRPEFPTLAHQRAHFRSEWHRYNLHVSLKGGSDGAAPVDEKGWEDLVNDLGEATDEEASGTGPEDNDQVGSSDSPSQANDLVSVVLRKLTIGSGKPSGAGDIDAINEEDESDIDEDGRSRRGTATAKSALLWFTTPETNDGVQGKVYLEQTQLGIYRSIYPDPASPSVEHLRGDAKDAATWHLSALRSLQAPPLRRAPDRKSIQGWRGKRLKGMEEAASTLGVNFLEGEGYVPGLVLKREDMSRSDAEDEEDESDGVVTSSESEDESSVGSVSLSRHVDPPIRTWTVLLFGGGHFSIAVVTLNLHIAPRAASRNRPLPEQGSDEEILQEDRSLIVLAHKAFHRYTTRRKQGGSQSAQDASGKFAKSAGAQLRRYGEQALAEEVRALLSLPGWRRLLSETERVYVRAGGRAARGILWSWPGATASDGKNAASASPLEGPRADGRLRNVPFSTRNKATVGECLRVFAELSRVKVGRRTEEELREEDEAYRRSLAGNDAAREELRRRREREKAEREEALRRARDKAKKRRGEKEGLSKTELKQRERFERMVEMVRRGRVEALVNHYNKYGEELLEGVAGEQAQAAAGTPTPLVDRALPAWWRAQQVASGSYSKKVSTGAAAGGSSASSSAPLVPSTLLHLAAEAAQEEVLQWLLVEMRANPTIGIAPPPAAASTPYSAPNSDSPSNSEATWPHRTAYDLLPSSSGAGAGASASDAPKAARNLFRRLYAQQPAWWDWSGMGAGGARVSDNALTEEMEGNQSRRKAQMRERARERAREREAKAAASGSGKTKEEAPPAPAPAPAPSNANRNRLGGSGPPVPRGLVQQKDRMEGVTPEMRMRIEREKRARAAEERMKKLAGGS